MAKLKKDGKPKLSGGKRKGAGAPKKAIKKKSVSVSFQFLKIYESD